MNPIQHKAKQYTLADLVHGLDIKIKGDPHCIIEGVCTIQNARPSHLTFLTNPLYKKYLVKTQAAAVILSDEDAENCPVNALITRNPYYAYSRIAQVFDTKNPIEKGIHATAVIGENSQIHPSARIGAYCVLGRHVVIGAGVILGPHCVIGDESSIGDDSKLDARVTIYHQVQLGNRVQLASGVVIGSDGFGIAKQNGVWHKVPQLGRVILGDDVEIGANTTIDRGAIEDTVIEKGVKIDNLVQVGHNVRVGENTAIAGCVGLAGSSSIGKNCLIGGGTGVNGHITVADNTVITGMTAVTKTISQSGIYSSGAGGLMTNLEWKKNSARLNRLEKLIQRVKNLEREKS